jgi:hypothetical protein
MLSFADEEDRTKLQRELFDNASSVGDLLQTGALKGQIARFLHKHKDGAG